MKKTLFLIVAVLGLSILSKAQPVNGTTSFFTNTTTALVPNTSCITTKTTNLSGWLFSVSSTSNCGFNWTNTTGGDGRLQYLVGFGTLTQASFESDDGSEFAMNNLIWGVSTSSWTSKSMRFVGYKNGFAVPGATLNATTPSGTGILNTVVVNFTSISGFNDVDAITLAPVGSATCNSILFFEEITIGTATVTSACPTPTLNLTGQTNVLCNGGSTGSATMSATGGSPFTYTWSPSGGNAATATGLSAGTYTCATTNSCGATGSRTVTITQPATALASSTAVTNALCNGANGSATITLSGGTLPYTYTWSSGPTTSVEPTLLAGTYTVRGTDGNGCTSTKSVSITQPSALVTATAVTNALCNGANGSATITASGGTLPYTYTWSSGPSTSVEPTLLAGTYTVRATDGNGCTSTKSVSITQPSALVTTTAITNVLCFGSSNGSATVTASGGTGSYTYLWSSAQTTSVISGLNAGVRTVTVTDANNCSSIKAVTITQPPALVTTTAITNVLCNGGNTGSATITASGGAGSYTYLWSSAQTTSVVSGLNTGVRTVTVTDANSCIGTNTVNITQPTVLSAAQSQTNITCTYTNGLASVNPSGGTGSYTYSWMPTGGTSSVSTALSSGNFTCSITDANNCALTQTFAITANTVIPTVSISGTFQVCMGQSAILTANGANTYSWNTSATTNTILASPSVLTTYSVIGTNTVNGCFGTTTHTLIVNAIPTLSVNSGSICSGQSFTITPSGANTYTIEGGNAVVSPTASTAYTVVGTSVNGCVSVSSATSSVTVNPNPTITGISNQILCLGNSFTLSPNGATSYTVAQGVSMPASFTTSIVITPTAGLSVYTVTGTSSLSCLGSNTLSTIVNPNPTVTALTSNSVICGPPFQGTATINASGASTYTWNTSAIGNSITVTPSVTTSYTVTGTDANGCVNSAIITQSVSTCTGIQQLGVEISAINVYPNPNNGILNVEVSTPLDLTSIVITNTLGQIMLNEKITTQHSLFNINHFTDGIYFVQILNNDKITVTKKIIKN